MTSGSEKQTILFLLCVFCEESFPPMKQKQYQFEQEDLLVINIWQLFLL